MRAGHVMTAQLAAEECMAVSHSGETPSACAVLACRGANIAFAPVVEAVT